MTILIVGNNASILKELKSAISVRCPSAKLVTKTDPLMAGKYSYNNEVDILLTEVDMKRMNGTQLIEFVRHERPAATAYLIVQEKNMSKYPLNEIDDVTGFIKYPFTDSDLDRVLEEHFA